MTDSVGNACGKMAVTPGDQLVPVGIREGMDVALQGKPEER